MWTLAIIIVSIVKWTGIVLLSVLGLILAVVAGVLLVPVRYRVYIEKKDQVYVKGHAAWLLHLLHLSFLVEGGQEKHVLRIFGIPMYGSEKSGGGSKSRKKSSKRKKSRKKETQGMTREEAPLSEAEQERPPAEEEDSSVAKQEDMPVERAYHRPASEKREAPEAERDSSEEQKSQESESPKRGWGKYKQKLQEFILSIRQLLGKIKKGFRRVMEIFQEGTTAENKDNLARKVRIILSDENTSQLWRIVWSGLASLWKHSRPRKLTGQLHFGTSDPGTTGQLLGLLSVGYGLTGGKLQLVPDFEESVLEGDLEMRGRIRIIHVLLLVKNIFWSKQWKHFKNQIE